MEFISRCLDFLFCGFCIGWRFVFYVFSFLVLGLFRFARILGYRLGFYFFGDFKVRGKGKVVIFSRGGNFFIGKSKGYSLVFFRFLLDLLIIGLILEFFFYLNRNLDRFFFSYV